MQTALKLAEMAKHLNDKSVAIDELNIPELMPRAYAYRQAAQELIQIAENRVHIIKLESNRNNNTKTQ